MKKIILAVILSTFINPINLAFASESEGTDSTSSKNCIFVEIFNSVVKSESEGTDNKSESEGTDNSKFVLICNPMDQK